VSDADQQLMLYPFIKKAVTERFSDVSISVREAAVSLVGTYVVNSPAVANAFHPAFMLGLSDTGVSVRKRTVKILQEVLCSNPRYKGRAAACSEMLRLAADPKEDDGVRDLIHDLFMKVWLENGDKTVIHESNSPITVTPPSQKQLMSPGGTAVMAVEVSGHAGLITPTPVHTGLFTPSPAKKTRSTDRVIRRKRMQVRSEIAAEQMVEVVKAADTGENLTLLFRELLSGASDADKTQRQRKKRKGLAQGHFSMLVDALFEILLSVEEHRDRFSSGVGKELVAIMRTIEVFADVSPPDVLKHLDTLMPYLKADNGLRMTDEALIISSLCKALARLALIFDKNDVDKLKGLSFADDLIKITYRFGRESLSAAIQVLCAVANHHSTSDSSPFRTKLLKLAQTFFDYLLRHRDDDDFESKKGKAKANIQRALGVLGSICRYSSGKDLLEAMIEDDHERGNELSWSNLTAICEDTFITFLEKNDPQTQCAALRALSGVFISHPRELLRMDQDGLTTRVMSSKASPSLQIESLRCWRDIILTEEARIESGEAKLAMDSKNEITLSKRISGDQDADATLFGGVLTSHSGRLFEMTQVQDSHIRFSSLDLIGNLLRQGQLNPNEAVPFLLALQGDIEEDAIRDLALKLLMIEGEKRPDMLRQRIAEGVKQAYLFQKSVYPDKKEVSALVSVRQTGGNEMECVFGGMFKACIATIKRQRRGLFRNLLNLFDLSNAKQESKTNGKKKAVCTITLEQLSLLTYTSQVLAYLPYSVASDPLYIIHYITSILALQGPDLLDRFANFLRPYGLASCDELDEANTSEDQLEIAAKRHLPRHAKAATPLMEKKFKSTEFMGLCMEAAALTLLLRLGVFFRRAYHLSEARCLSFNPDTKDRVIEKGANREKGVVFDSKVAVLGTHGGEDATDVDCMIWQYAEFRRLMRYEATLQDQEDDSDDEDAGTSKRKRDDETPMEISSP